MAKRQMNNVLHHLRRALVGEPASLTDGQLLRRFVERRDEAAFATLVQRHGPMALGVCRRVLGNAQDAEDAFQAAFLVLVRKATTLAGREVVGDWLHGVAYRTALKARAARSRRRAKERAMPPAQAHTDDVGPELLALLDRELSGLPAKYRLPIVLCDLQGKTQREAARQLGWPEGTVSGRRSRGRALLARRLGRHGLTLSAATLAAALVQEGAPACVPAPLARHTVLAAVALAAGQAGARGVIPAQVVALMEGVLKTMLITKLKIAARVVLLVLIGLAAGAGGWANWAAEASGQASEPVPTRGKLDEEKTASVPFGTETIDLLPVGPMPVPFLVRLKPDGKLRVQRPVPVYMPVTETYEDGRTGTGYRLITHVLREDVDPERDRIEVYNVQGKRLDPNALSGLLKGDTVALLFPDGRSADPRLFKLFREGTLFFVLPTLSSPPAVPTRPVIEVIEEEVPPVVVPPAAAAPSKHETAPRPRTMRLRSGDYQRLQTKTRRNIADVAVLKPTIIRVDPVPNDPTSIMVTGLLAGATDLILGGVDNTRETVVVLVEDASAQIRPRLYRGKPMSYWIEQLSDGDPSYRKEAVTVLGVISQDDRSAIELLLGALRDKDATVRNEAVYYLGYAGAPAVPPLIGLLKEEGPLRALAALALAYHGRDAKPAMTALIDVLKSHDPEARRAAARALGGIGPKAKEAIPAIIQAFKQGRIMQQDVFTALVQIEPEIYKIIPRRFFDGDTSCEEKKKAWQEAIEELEKRYPPRASKPVR